MAQPHKITLECQCETDVICYVITHVKSINVVRVDIDPWRTLHFAVCTEPAGTSDSKYDENGIGKVLT